MLVLDICIFPLPLAPLFEHDLLGLCLDLRSDFPIILKHRLEELHQVGNDLEGQLQVVKQEPGAEASAPHDELCYFVLLDGAQRLILHFDFFESFWALLHELLQLLKSVDICTDHE